MIILFRKLYCDHLSDIEKSSILRTSCHPYRQPVTAWQAIDVFEHKRKVQFHLVGLLSAESQWSLVSLCRLNHRFSEKISVPLRWSPLSGVAGTQVWTTRWMEFSHRNDTYAVWSFWRFFDSGCLFSAHSCSHPGDSWKPDSLCGQNAVLGLLRILGIWT